MKKVLLAIMIVLVFSLNALGAVDNTITTDDITTVTVDSKHVKYIYPFVDSVAAGATEEWLIPADDISGSIVEIYWESLSENCNSWVSQSVDALATDADTIIYMTDIVLGYSPELSSPRYYYNASGKLYVTIKNDDLVNATGVNAILIITYERE